ncbi:MAG: RNA polymerase sporulation sigma factor SigK [Clostridia bacterium]|nr:RNA polymerase sporulation sigma factor SigK [Clostridia bacterium]
MLMGILQYLSSVLFLFLHVQNSGSFPKALSAAEERRCLEQMEKGDAAARQKLIEHNLRLVVHIAKKYYADENDRDDLVSIGTIGLIKAIDSFKPDKGIRLSSYASRCIENEILMFFRGAKKTAQDISLNEPIDTDKDGNTLTLLDTISAENDIVEDIDLRIKVRRLYAVLGKVLTDREKEIIVLRYGLSGQRPLVQREVAKKLHISRSYISRIEKKALEKLRGQFGE